EGKDKRNSTWQKSLIARQAVKRNKLARRTNLIMLVSLISSCAFQPALSVRENKVEDQSIIKLVKLDSSLFSAVDTPESREAARKNFLAKITPECSHPHLLTEEKSEDPKLPGVATKKKTTAATEQA